MTKNFRAPELPPLVIEYHYADGDVGAYEGCRYAQELWKRFSDGVTPERIVIRQRREHE